MPDVEEKVPLQDPGDAESGACEPETSVPTQGDKSGPEDHPPRRSSPAGPVALGGA